MLCRNCKNKLKPFLSLGKMPLVNSFIKKSQIKSEKKFDLTVAFCEKCFLVQLVKTVPPTEMFRNYLYFSSTSSSFLKHCEEIADKFTKRFGLGPDSLFVEIASNDGAQLRYFKNLGVQVLGIDPAKNIAKIANAKGLKTIPEFFNLKLAQKLSKQGTKADLVYGANVLAHVPEITDFVRGVKQILAPAGTAVFEFPYLKGLIENKFDTIYHEHVFYYSLIALKNLFQTADLEIYNVEKTSMQGGSLLIFVAHPGQFKINQSVKSLTASELRAGYNKIKLYRKIADRVQKLKADLLSLLKNLKSEGKTIAAYGAAAKGTVLMNYFGIGSYLNFIADLSKAKQGLHVPGVHLLVHSPDHVLETKPDYLLILPWNISEEIIQQFDGYKKAGGKFIIPVPNTRII